MMGALDPTGIRVDLIRVPHEGRGHPSWILPLGGGSIEVEPRQLDGRERVRLEIRPDVELEWTRDYKEIEKIAQEVEKQGGFMWSGDDIQVGNNILVGRDAMKLLTELNHRANDRAGKRGAEYEQGYKDGVEAAREAATNSIRSLKL